MPVIREKYYPDGNLLSIWKITEPEEELVGGLTLSDAETRHLETIKAPVRRLHWLAGRTLAAKYHCGYQQIRYSSSGKPIVEGATNHFSIAHSGVMAAFTLSDKPTGVDIEQITPRIQRIKERFMNADELNSLNNIHSDDTLYIYWCAKEAIIKWYGDPSLDFRNQISIAPFTKDRESGSINATVYIDGAVNRLGLIYEKLDNYMLVYTQ